MVNNCLPNYISRALDGTYRVTFLGKNYEFHLPIIDGITSPSWFTELQLHLLENFFAIGLGFDGNIQVLDSGTGSMIVPMVLANFLEHNEATIDAIELNPAFSKYADELERLYGSQSWWEKIRPRNGDCVQDTGFYDIVMLSLPSEPFPVGLDEMESVCRTYNVRPATFSDGGHHGIELLHSFVRSHQFKPNGILMVYHPAYAFDRATHQSARESTSEKMEENGLDVIFHKEVSVPVPDGGIVTSRLELYRDRLGWEPEIIEGSQLMDYCLFIARKR